MQSRVLAISALAIASLPAAAAFVAPAAHLSRGAASHGATAAGACAALPLFPARTGSAVRMTQAADTGVPDGQKAFEAGERTMDEWFAMLADRCVRISGVVC